MDRIESSDDYTVKVKAQVMVRDDNKGGWLPITSAMSVIGICKRPLPQPLPQPLPLSSTDYTNVSENTVYEYSIFGQRISDRTEVINCKLKCDLEYTHNQRNPTFVHWRNKAGGTRYGLTFLSYSDARAFDKGFRRALLDLSGKTAVEEEVFMPVDLPMGQVDSSSTVSTTTSSPSTHSPITSTTNSTQEIENLHQYGGEQQMQHLQRVIYITRPKPKSGTDNSSKTSDKSDSSTQSGGGGGGGSMLSKRDSTNTSSNRSQRQEINLIDLTSSKRHSSNSYVEFKPKSKSIHVYQYPNSPKVMNQYTDPALLKQDKQTANQPPYNMLPPPLPKKKRKGGKTEPKGDYLLTGQRLKCKYCQNWYSIDDNPRGSCPDAPDTTQAVIDKATCIPVGECIMYHCVSDSEGNFNHPCMCESSSSANCRKWTLLTILSLFCPCLLCYWPMTLGHRGCLTMGCCKGRHHPS